MKETYHYAPTFRLCCLLACLLARLLARPPARPSIYLSVWCRSLSNSHTPVRADRAKALPLVDLPKAQRHPPSLAIPSAPPRVAGLCVRVRTEHRWPSAVGHMPIGLHRKCVYTSPGESR
jgi:hypothetical protein